MFAWFEVTADSANSGVGGSCDPGEKIRIGTGHVTFGLVRVSFQYVVKGKIAQCVYSYQETIV